MEDFDGCLFGIQKTGDESANRDIMDQIAAMTGGYKTLSDVLDNLNRTAQPGITDDHATRLTNHEHLGFRWNSGDMSTTAWYPQSITGGSDRQEDGRPEGRRLLLVGWYDKQSGEDDTAPKKGVRLALVDLTDPESVSYRLILLVTPSLQNNRATFGPVLYDSGGSLHAGGIVWIGDLLYVTDTNNGFRIFDMTRIIEATGFDDDVIGIVDGEVHAHSYRYVIPQITRYDPADGACHVKFSFAGLDRSSTPEATIVSGEYHGSINHGLMVSWPVDLGSGWLVEDPDGIVRGVGAVVSGQDKMQGGLTWEGDYYISTSSQTNSRPEDAPNTSTFGRLYRTRPGLTSSISAWVYGAEDLYYERDTNRIWTPAEHPGFRDTVSIELLPPD